MKIVNLIATACLLLAPVHGTLRGPADGIGALDTKETVAETPDVAAETPDAAATVVRNTIPRA